MKNICEACATSHPYRVSFPFYTIPICRLFRIFKFYQKTLPQAVCCLLTLAEHVQARVIALGLCVCVCLSADSCPPFFSTTTAALSFKRGYVLR